MTEDEYQAIIIPLRNELSERADAVIDVLVSQPAKRIALDTVRDFAWWCLTQGAAHAPAILERARRKQLAQHGAA